MTNTLELQVINASLGYLSIFLHLNFTSQEVVMSQLARMIQTETYRRLICISCFTSLFSSILASSCMMRHRIQIGTQLQSSAFITELSPVAMKL